MIVQLDWTQDALDRLQQQAFARFIQFGTSTRRAFVAEYEELGRRELAVRAPVVQVTPDAVLTGEEAAMEHWSRYAEKFMARHGRYPCTTAPYTRYQEYGGSIEIPPRPRRRKAKREGGHRGR